MLNIVQKYFFYTGLTEAATAGLLFLAVRNTPMLKPTCALFMCNAISDVANYLVTKPNDDDKKKLDLEPKSKPNRFAEFCRHLLSCCDVLSDLAFKLYFAYIYRTLPGSSGWGSIGLAILSTPSLASMWLHLVKGQETSGRLGCCCAGFSFTHSFRFLNPICRIILYSNITLMTFFFLY